MPKNMGEARACQQGRNSTPKKCLDCPATVYGNRLRCPPCADAQYERLRSIRRKKRWADQRD
jgi:hypothetical protein